MAWIVVGRMNVARGLLDGLASAVTSVVQGGMAMDADKSGSMSMLFPGRV